MKFSLLSFVVLITTSFVANFLFAKVSYPQIDNNVPYAEVIKLPFQVADHKIPYGKALLQYGLFWEAQADDHEHPLVIFIHGGCWLNAFDIKHTYPFATALSQEGYPVWSLEYRRIGDEGGGWPGTYQDIVAGIRAAKDLGSYGVDASSVIIMGHSAGGHLAVLASTELEELESNAVKGVVGLAAITNIQQYAEGKNSCQTATPALFGGTYEEKQPAYDAANLAAKFHSKDKKPLVPKTYLLHGDKDAIVPISHAKLNTATTVIEEGAGHFDWIHPGSNAFQRLLQVLNGLVEKDLNEER